MNPVLTKTKIFGDDRGIFFPLSLESSHGKRWIQSNISSSKKWTFRGLHHQLGAASQSKLITVIKGSIIDFVVDLRKGHFKESAFFKLEKGDQIFVPRGFAHGFLSLEEDTMIQYLVDNEYDSSSEISFDYKSVELVNEVLLAEVGSYENLIISEKDSAGVHLDSTFAESLDDLK